MNALKPDDFFKYKFLSAVEYSPDGKRAAFVVANADTDNNSYERRIWLYENGALKQLTDMGKEGSFVWEGSDCLLFPAVRSAAEKKRAEAKEAFTSYYRLSLGGGEALHAFTLPFACSGIKKLNDYTWLAVGDVDLKAPDYALMTEEERKKYAASLEADKDYEVFDENPFWMNGAGITNGHRAGLFICHIDGDEVSVCRLTDPGFDLIDILIDGSQAYVTGTERHSVLNPYTFSLYRVSADNIAENSVADLSNGSPNRSLNCTSNVLSDGTSNGLSNGTSNVLSNGTSNVLSSGTSNVLSDGTSNGSSDGSSAISGDNRTENSFGFSLHKISDYAMEGGDLCRIGGRLCVFATEAKRYGLNENQWIYAVDTETGSLSLLHEEEYSMYNSVGSDCRLGGGKHLCEKDGKLYYVTTLDDSAFLYCLSPDGTTTPVITGKGSIDCIDLPKNSQTALLVAQYGNRLQELYEADLTTGKLKPISHFNDAVLSKVYVASYEAITIQSRGLTINGYVLLPKDYDPEKTNAYPAVLDVHGGPKTVYGPVFYHEMQLWANMGYFVFFCNPKGSDGRGNEFADIRGKYGETDYANLMDFTDAVLEKYPQIDPKRLCLTGGSYGGFMTNWIIGHTDRFCCAASQRSIANWISMYGISDIGPMFATDQNLADPFTSPEKLWEHSPMKYAANVKTPTLFIHSDEDYRCPLAEGLQMHTSLLMQGVPTRLCLFHGENHDLSRSGKPQHRLRRLKEITDWFEKYSKR